MMIIIFIELCRIADSLLWIPKSSRRTSSIFYIPNIIALLKMESQQLSQNSPTLQLCIQNILEVLLKDIGILKMESVFLHNNILLFFFILYVSLSYYIINICISASITVDDCFSIFTSSFYTACDNILVTRILLKR
ncbi:HN1_G0051510.mRNA.1.CDS.1 [Saccharomyces cerevisiae]|nr:HN1_G0051510.mRNA.1.CDS.1 [Saccharomyces cerevisiae]